MSSRRRSRSRSNDRASSSGSSRSGSPEEEEEEDGARLHVADLGMGISKRELEHIFDKYGALREVWVAKSPPCFAFVVFRDKDDAEDALKATDGITLCGSRIRVTFARPRTRGRGRRGFDPNMRCYQCGDKGHFSRDCPDTKYGYKRPPSSRSPSGAERPDRGGGDRYDRGGGDRYDRGGGDRYDRGGGDRYDRGGGERYDRGDRYERYDRGDRYDRGGERRGSMRSSGQSGSRSHRSERH